MADGELFAYLKIKGFYSFGSKLTEPLKCLCSNCFSGTAETQFNLWEKNIKDNDFIAFSGKACNGLYVTVKGWVNKQRRPHSSTKWERCIAVKEKKDICH